MQIILHGSIPSKKNSKRIICKPFPKLLPSENYVKWEKEQVQKIHDFIKKNGDLTGKYNLSMTVHFKPGLTKARKPKKKSWDLSNKIESIQDMLVTAGFISEDNRFVISELHCFHSPYENDTIEDITIVTFKQND